MSSKRVEDLFYVVQSPKSGKEKQNKTYYNNKLMSKYSLRSLNYNAG